MGQHDPHEINRLIGEFMDLQEAWQGNQEHFDWNALQALAQKGAHAYNDGAGPSFHSLALDGMEHREFHERFLEYSLQAGFDPFRLTHLGSASAELPVIDHDDMAKSARSNPSSARMHAMLMEQAKKTFAGLAQALREGKPEPEPGLVQAAVACAESLPLDLLEQVAPELADSQRRNIPKQAVDPIEGYLSPAEVTVDRASEFYG